MTFFDSLKTCLVEKPFTIKGRACKSEFWWFALAFYLFCGFMVLVLSSIKDVASQENLIHKAAFVVVCILMLFFLIAYFCATVRRLHDASYSGGNIFLRFIPYIGSFIVLYMLCKKGDEGNNMYGPNPLNSKRDLTAGDQQERKQNISNEEPKTDIISDEHLRYMPKSSSAYAGQNHQALSTQSANTYSSQEVKRIPAKEKKKTKIITVAIILFLISALVFIFLFLKCSETKVKDWPTYEFNNAFSIKVPESFELRSKNDVYTKVAKQNLEIFKIDYDISEGVVFQQKGLAKLSRSSFDTYARVLISYFPLDDLIVEHHWESITIDDEVKDFIDGFDEDDLRHCRIAEAPTYDCINVNEDGSHALTITYEREGYDGPVLCKRYILYNHDELVSIMIAYRKSDSQIWENDCKRIISTFKWLNPK